MKPLTLSAPLRRKPLTAAQYLFACESRRNARACRRIDAKEAAIRGAWYFTAATSIIGSAAALVGSIIHLVLSA
jgi:hypothetical protein